MCDENRSNTVSIVVTIGRRIRAITHEARSWAFLILQISVVLQHGNAASVLGTMEPTPSVYIHTSRGSLPSASFYCMT